MATTANGVRYPEDSDPYVLTDDGTGLSDLARLAYTAGQKALDAAAEAAQAAWERRWDPQQLALAADLNTVTEPGEYIVRSLSTTNRPPTEAFGSLKVHHFGGGDTDERLFQTYIAGWPVPELWVRRSMNSGSTWDEWVRIDAGRWDAATLAADADLNAVTAQGRYIVRNLNISNRPPAEVFGSLDVQPFGSGTLLQTFTAGFATPEVWVRRYDGTTWGQWGKIGQPWYRTAVTAGQDLNDFTSDGYYGVNPSATITNRPIYDSNAAILEVFRHGTGLLQRYTSIRATGQTVWVRRGNAGTPNVWFDWTQVNTGGGGGGGGDAAALPRRELLQQGLRARKGGTIGTGGRGVVSLRFDDAAGDFARDVLPLLEERALPFTRVTTTDRVGNTAGGEDDTWPNIQDYCIRAGGEVWNHGKTHGSADTPAQIDAEVSGALATLRTNLPRLPIDCWSPPGGQTTGWDGYMPAETIEQLTESYAGQQIMAHHALSSGYLTNTWYPPLDGVLRDGQLFYSSDIRDFAFIKTLIDRARDYPSGVTIMFHANNIGEDGHTSAADFVDVLDYIAAQRDAGNILVLTVSGQAVADAASDHRHDLLKTHTGTDWSEFVAFPAARPGITGSTRELTATVTGTPEATVTSVVGESTKEHTIPAGGTLTLRHPATIPTDATSVPVSITGGATADAHLYAI